MCGGAPCSDLMACAEEPENKSPSMVVGGGREKGARKGSWSDDKSTRIILCKNGQVVYTTILIPLAPAGSRKTTVAVLITQYASILGVKRVGIFQFVFFF